MCKIDVKLCKIDVKNKSTGVDMLNPYLLQLSALFVAEPLAYILNMTILPGTIPEVQKVANVLPLHKGGRVPDQFSDEVI